MLVHIGDDKHEVKDWSDVLEVVVTHLGENYSEQFSALQLEFPRVLSTDANKIRTPRKLANGYFFETNMSANRIYRLCEQLLDFMGCRDQWHVDTRS